jgi:hypothetical protein
MSEKNELHAFERSKKCPHMMGQLSEPDYRNGMWHVLMRLIINGFRSIHCHLIIVGRVAFSIFPTSVSQETQVAL